MRVVSRILIAGALAALAAPGGAGLAQEAPAAAPDDGRFIFDSARPPVRRNFNANSPIVQVDPEDVEALDVLPAMEMPPDVVREAPTVSLNGARVAAEDTEAVADFYESAFGMWEVQRIPLPAAPEIMLNFGETQEAAMANPNGDIVIYPREGGMPEGDDVAHIVFDVSDAAAVVAEVEHYGGTVLTAPFEFGDTGIFIAIVADPAGNQIELIQGAQ